MHFAEESDLESSKLEPTVYIAGSPPFIFLKTYFLSILSTQSLSQLPRLSFTKKIPSSFFSSIILPLLHFRSYLNITPDLVSYLTAAASARPKYSLLSPPGIPARYHSHCRLVRSSVPARPPCRRPVCPALVCPTACPPCECPPGLLPVIPAIPAPPTSRGCPWRLPPAIPPWPPNIRHQPNPHQAQPCLLRGWPTSSTVARRCRFPSPRSQRL